ncbi:RelA/SpoT family protein [Acaryochloris marina]|uniref:PpGpp 3'-pyrophosphohydrolase n=1 Tax=Acaryochloris marina (strain MBIC 11017) TaxID=329726 RepID=B0C5E6_ACAM1|nr:bifunctional (p)ppGpp synthetase/guanosine-3',5'-bis(diphosphate) 3'-pyrophosphohydrolase [Acaryochloris marina]ABW27522.1 ppGpp 3'-pyrophosphohydrolase [Acaryochloris marina MBIC11017]BDM82257.1 GTP pyrophosphokinase [Acaryochloris marina MBIC10699]
MNLKATVSPTDLELPIWLQECMLEVDGAEDKDGIPEQTLICRAFNFGYQLHEGQRRASGEPYIAHPVSVAELLRDLGGSAAMIAAGFLHDVVEDTDVTPETIEAEFGLEVRQLVEGVTKLSKFNFSTKTEREAENFRRMFLAMAQDIRVIVVKLADRLHNMRTLEHLPPVKQRRIAQETRDVFAPLANRLGIWRFKWELEDLAFKYLEPDTYRRMQQLVADKRTDREDHIEQAITILHDRLEPICSKHLEISGRPKHLFSISQKMERQQKEFHEIYDVAAVRVIVKTNEECYRALAVVHDCFRPIPGRFKDYIGLPKSNRYQSLHTVVIGLGGRPLEVQIRTEAMHHIAEYGIAAHWKYKESSNQPGKAAWSPDDEKFTWLRQLLEWQSDLKDAQEYLDNVKDNLFDSEVYVFTPKGDLIDLTQGATPVDFAYRIHTEVGNHCFGARVNGRMVTLDTPLDNGDIVEIMTQNSAHPSLDWLNFAASNAARNRIRQWYKRSHREENILRGREMLEKALGKKGFDALLKSEPMQIVANRCNYQTPDDLLAALGYGEVTLNSVANRLRETIRSQQAEAEPATSDLTDVNLPTQASPRPLPSSGDSPITGVEGLVYHMAGCCHPVPGEPIIGAVTLSNRGISIHRQGCKNIGNIPGDRLIPVSWNPTHPSQQSRRYTYPIEVQIEVIDRVGILKDILTRLTDSKVNVHNAQVKTFPGQTAVINLGLDIEHCNQLDQICAQIRKMSDVLKLRRLSQVED